MAEMSALSAVREKRLFQKSASQQYKFAKRLSPAQRGELEQALQAEILHPTTGDTERRDALTMWMSVQQARLRTHDPAHRQQHSRDQADALEVGVWGITLPLVPLMLRSQRRGYYNSPIRPEYAAAFDNFMRMLRDPGIPPELREVVAQQLDYHRRSERTIAPRQAELLRAQGAMGLAASGYLVSADRDLPPPNATERQVLQRRAQMSAAGQIAPPSPSPTQEVLTDAVSALTGTHIDGIDLTGLTGLHTQQVIDHLQDLGDPASRPRTAAAEALRRAGTDVEQIVRNLSALVGNGVLSQRTLARAARAERDTQAARAAQARVPRMAPPAVPSPTLVLLTEAASALNGTHANDLDLTHLAAGHAQEVIDHLHDLADPAGQRQEAAVRALQRGGTDLEQIIGNLHALVAAGTLSERTTARAARSAQAAEAERAARAERARADSQEAPQNG